jgi:hypothetical protein
MTLSDELQHLPEDYHNHSHKLFRRHSLGHFPPMEAVLGRLFRMAESDAARVGAECIARIDPPAARPLFDPAGVIEACDRALERQNVPGDRRQAVLEMDGAPIAHFSPELDEAIMERAFDSLHGAVRRENGIALSTLLTRSAGAQEGERFPAAVAMAVFQCLVDRRIGRKHRIRIQLPDPAQRIGIDLPGGRRYQGHELLLIRRPAARPSSQSS